MQYRFRRFRRYWLALLSIVLGSTVGLGLYLLSPGRAPSLDRSADLLLHDTALLMLSEHTPLRTAAIQSLTDDNPQLRLVTIDEASLHEAQRDALGQYRVPREVYAHLVDRLREGGARVIAFDLQFATDAENVAQDTRFAAALAKLPSILSYDTVSYTHLTLPTIYSV